MPRSECVRASRVREICKPGLKRAEAAGYTAPRYSTWFDHGTGRDQDFTEVPTTKEALKRMVDQARLAAGPAGHGRSTLASAISFVY
jgi:hypothetical protein